MSTKYFTDGGPLLVSPSIVLYKRGGEGKNFLYTNQITPSFSLLVSLSARYTFSNKIIGNVIAINSIYSHAKILILLLLEIVDSPH